MSVFDKGKEVVEKIDNQRLCGNTLVQIYENYRDTLSTNKVNNYNEHMQQAQNFQGTTVKTFTNDVFNDVKKMTSRDFGVREERQDASVNELRNKFNSLGYREPNAGEDRGGR